MPNYAIIDTNAGKIINVVEYDAAPSNPPPGFAAGIVAVQSDQADTTWTWNGTALVPPPPPVIAPPPPSVMSQDLMAQFTTTDIATIESAISSNTSYALLWYSMLAQRDPMVLTNARFVAGWNALVTILTQARMNQIATALSLPSLVVTS